MNYATYQAVPDIDEMIEDFTVMKRETPKMFNLLRDISDR